MPSAMNVLSPISNLGGGKGATNQQNQIASSQQSFMNTLQQDFGTVFAGQQNILQGLTKSLTATMQAGPSQFGFSVPEVTALDTMATQGNAQAYQNARAAAGEAAAAQGGGAMLPTGSQGAQTAQLAEQSALNQSNALLGIQEAGFKQGSENYKESISGLTGVAGLENPSGMAGQATGAGEAAAGTAAQIQKENAAASPWSQVGGLVGSLAGAALNAYLPGAGTALSGASGALAKGQMAGYAPGMGADTTGQTSNFQFGGYQDPNQQLNLSSGLYGPYGSGLGDT